jgi:cobalt/nickel transport system ATP-binding protein
MPDNGLISLEDIHFAYPGRAELFAGIDLYVEAGNVLGIVGANGSGKTTLFRIMVGLLHPQRGTITAFGQPIRSRRDYDDLRRRVGFLFQDSEDQLFCPTVAEDVAFGPLNLGKSRDEARAIVRQTLNSLGLADFAERISYELSGGEKRLVALATALAMRPEVLLLDEPASGLDPRARRELVEQLARIGGTQVIGSHDMEFVRSSCRRVVVIDAGRIIADGPTDAILGDASLMLSHGLEVPHSLVAEAQFAFDHHHGTGPSHGHGHDTSHERREHAQGSDSSPAG